MSRFQAKIHRWNRISRCHFDQKVAGRVFLAWKTIFRSTTWSLIGLSVCFTFNAASQETTSHEPSLRGAVIAGILRFTYWQEHIAVNTNKLTLCLVGNPNSSLPILHNKFNKPIGEVFQVSNNDPVESLIDKQCQVVVLGAQLNVATVKNIQKNAATRSWLTICDGCKQHDLNTIITLHKIDSRIAFNIDLDAAKQSQLRFSASLLELASKVEG